MTWACLGYVQGLTNIFGPQNRTQGHCDMMHILYRRKRHFTSKIFYIYKITSGIHVMRSIVRPDVTMEQLEQVLYSIGLITYLLLLRASYCSLLFLYPVSVLGRKKIFFLSG